MSPYPLLSLLLIPAIHRRQLISADYILHSCFFFFTVERKRSHVRHSQQLGYDTSD